MEVFSRGIWGYVAALSNASATLVCRQLFGADMLGVANGTLFTATEMRPSAVVWRDGDACNSESPSFLSCAYEAPGWESTNPLYQVACYNPSAGGEAAGTGLLLLLFPGCAGKRRGSRCCCLLAYCAAQHLGGPI